MRIEERLRASAATHGTHAAVMVGRTCHSYAELDLKSERLGAELADHGLAAGERVLCFLEEGWEAVVSAFAVFKAGAVLVPVEAGAAANVLLERLQATQPAAVVTQSRLGEIVAAAIAPLRSVRLVVLCGGDRSRTGGTCVSFETAVERMRRTPPLPVLGSDVDAAVLISDEVALSHRQLLEEADSNPADQEGRALPSLSSRAGLLRLLTAMSAGQAMVAPLSFTRAAVGEWTVQGMLPEMAPRRLAGLVAGATPAFQR